MVSRLLSWSIRTHLVILLLLLALPCIVVTVHSGIKARSEAIDEVKRERLRFVDTVATEQQAVVAGAQQLGTALALLPEIRSGNRGATSAILSHLLKTNPQYTNIIVADKSGAVCASAAPFEGKISVADRRYFKEAVRTGTFSSGEYSIGRIYKKPIMIFGYPVKGDANEVIAVIGIILDLIHTQNTFEKIGVVPPGTSFSLLDHQGVIFIRSLKDGLSEKLEGRRDIREELFTRMKGGPDEGTFESMGNDGKPRLLAYKRIRLPEESVPYLYIRSSTPLASVISKANALMIKNLALFLLVFGAGLLLVGLIGKRVIANPILLLKKASEQLSAGTDTVNVSRVVKGGELGELARAFDGMAEVLARRETSLRESEERYRRLFEDAVLGVFQSTPGGKIIAVNGAYARMFGYASPDELMAAVSDVALDIYADPTRRPPIVEMITETGKPVRIENVYKRKDGSTFIGNLHAWSARNSKGEFTVEGFVEDISDRKQAEEANARLAAIVEFSDDAIIGKDLSGTIVSWNKGAEKIYGYTAKEVINKSISILAPPDHIDEVSTFLDQIRRGESIEHYETVRLKKDGSWIDVSLTISPIKDATGAITGASTIARDITERKRAEEALRERQEMLQAIFDAVPESILLVDREGAVMSCNAVVARRLGKTVAEIVGTNAFFDHLPPDVARYRKERFDKVVATGEPISFQDTRSERFLEHYHYPVFNEQGNVSGVTIFARDITERTQAEEALRESDIRLRESVLAMQETVRAGNIGLWDWDLRTDRVFYSPEWKRQIGYEDHEISHDFEEWRSRVHPDDLERSLEYVGAFIKNPWANYQIEFRFRHKDGSYRWIMAQASLIHDEQGEPIRMLGSHVDITDRKGMEESLKMAEEQYRVAIEASNDGVAIVQGNRHVYVNRRFLEIFGFDSKEEVLSQDRYCNIHPDDREKIETYHTMRMESGNPPGTYEFKGIRKDGSIVHIEVSVARILFRNQPATLAYLRDITARKEAEKTLRESEERHRTLFENMVQGAFYQQADGVLIDANPAALEIFGLTRDQFLGKTSDDAWWKVIDQEGADIPGGQHPSMVALRTGEAVRNAVVGVYNVRKNSVVWVNVNAIPQFLPGENIPCQVFVTLHDITDRKRAEEQIKVSLHEKEVLLKEIHHRVKNNLQVISSLLNMQSKYVDEQSVGSFRESMDRVKSMALVHDKLYRSESLSRIYFADYISDLSRELLRTYATDRDIELDLHVDPLSFDVDTAMPLGLIVSELISNALKHAFPESLGGTITIHLKSLGEQIVLTISDNGIGFPDDVDFKETPSLGMQLVVTLVEQLEGTIELKRDKGTEFRVVFGTAG